MSTQVVAGEQVRGAAIDEVDLTGSQHRRNLSRRKSRRLFLSKLLLLDLPLVELLFSLLLRDDCGSCCEQASCQHEQRGKGAEISAHDA